MQSANRKRRAVLAGGWTLFAATLIGCASPAVPKPPSLHLPEIAKGVTADRVGNQVTLRWTTPSETTDHLKIKGPVTAVICREQPSRRRGSGACSPVDKKAVAPGEPAEVIETVPPELTTDPAHSLTWRVELQNDRGRSAGRSEPAWTASGQPPGPVDGLTVISRREGALIRWTPQPGQSLVEVRRVRLDPPAKKSSAPGSPSGSIPKEIAIVLEAPPEASSPDKGGMLDTSVERQAHYRYTAQRVLQLAVGGHDVKIRGAESAAITFTPRDTFAPAPPTGLVAIPASGSIDLSWEAGSEPDLAGYNVYRRSGETNDTAETKLTPEPVAGPAFRDMTVAAGTAYLYRVTAIDANGNESARSPEVRETGR